MFLRNYQQLAVALLFSAVTVNAQLPNARLPRGFSSASVDSQLKSKSAIVVSITADDQFYVGKELVAKTELSNRIATAIRQHTSVQNTVIYIAIDRSVIYKVVVRVLNLIREQGIGHIALLVDRHSSGQPLMGVFPIFVPMPFREGDDISKLKPNPLTLAAAIDDHLQLTLNHDRAGHRGQLCFDAVPHGLNSNPSQLKNWLTCLFRYRMQQRAYRQGMETRTDLPLEQRIEKTVFVKAPLSVKYIDVLRVINAVASSRADPIGLQIDDLPN